MTKSRTRATITSMEMLYDSREAGRLTGRSRKAVNVLARRYNIGRKLGRDWIFTDADLARIRDIDPRGGRPTIDGRPIRYRVTLAQLAPKGPRVRSESLANAS